MLEGHFSSLQIFLPAAQVGLLDWWLLLRKDHNKLKQRGIDSVVMLVMWAIWKERTRGPSTVRRREAPMNWWTPFGRMVSSGCLPELSGWRLWDGRIPQPELQVFLGSVLPPLPPIYQSLVVSGCRISPKAM